MSTIQPSDSAPPRVALTSEQDARFLADLVLKHSTGESTFVALHDRHEGTTRFANNQVVQNVNARRLSLSVTVAFGQQHGSAGTSDCSVGAVRDALRRAEAVARLSPPDPEYLPPVSAQTYVTVPTWRAETDQAGYAGRAEGVRAAIGLSRNAGMQAAGIVSSSSTVVALAASTGLMAYESGTDARFSVTVTDGEATGWNASAHRSIARLEIAARTRAAVEKARRGAEPTELPPGRYTVVLEPPAVVGLLSWVSWMLDAKAYDKGTSPFRGRLGQPVIDSRLTLENRPAHPDLLGVSFTGEGLPTTETAWIERGVLRHLAYDRFTARQHGVDRIPTLEAPVLAAEHARTGGCVAVEDLIRGTERGILVSNFWYIRSVNPTDLTLTGMTRDGTFLIEDGRVTRAVRNFRFHDSPLRVFNQVEQITTPMEATTGESDKLLVPAMKLRDFHFTSVTRF